MTPPGSVPILGLATLIDTMTKLSYDLIRSRTRPIKRPEGSIFDRLKGHASRPRASSWHSGTFSCITHTWHSCIALSHRVLPNFWGCKGMYGRGTAYPHSPDPNPDDPYAPMSYVRGKYSRKNTKTFGWGQNPKLWTEIPKLRTKI